MDNLLPGHMTSGSPELLPPANVVCEGYIFTGICDSVNRGGGMCGFIRGGMRGFIRGACMVLFGGCAWFHSGGMRGFIQGGMHGFIWGVCMVLFGLVCMVLFRGHAWFYLGRGVCMVLFGGHAWFYSGGCAWFFQFFRIQ